MIPVPDHIASLEPYVPGKPLDELFRERGIRDAVKLASNENPLGPSPKAVEAAREHLAGVHRYPDGPGFDVFAALSAHFDLPADHFILGNGSNELIELAIRTFLNPGEEGVMAWPSFVVYPSIVQAGGGVPVKVPLKQDRHDLNKMAGAVTDRTRIVFIANPNNPTGTINSREEVDAFIEDLPEGVLVVLDEAYAEYVTAPEYPDSVEYVRRNKDVLLLKTFSKAYGLAGLRIGYGLGNPRILEAMNRIRQPFNTNSIAHAAAVAALGDSRHLENTRSVNREGRDFLYGEFDRLKVRYVNTQTNFIFFRVREGSAPEINERLLDQGVIVRPMGPSAFRVTIGLPEENQRFIEALETILGDPAA